MAEVEVNYLDRIKKYINYDNICSLIIILAKIMNMDQKRRKLLYKNNMFTIVKFKGQGYQVKIEEKEINISSSRGANLAVYFNLSPVYNRETGETSIRGIVNFRIEISEFSAIIFTDIIDWITDYDSVTSLQPKDLQKIDPIYRINYGKDYFRVFNLVTDSCIGSKDGYSVFKINDGKVVTDTLCKDENEEAFLQEINKTMRILRDDEMRKYIFDDDALYQIIAIINQNIPPISEKSDTGNNILSKVIGRFKNVRRT